ELRFLIGPNGAGKTTMLDVITGKTRPDSGRIVFEGHVDVRHHSEDALVRLGIGRKFQTPAVYQSLTVAENVEVALGARGGLARLFRRVSSEDAGRVDSVLSTVGLGPRRARSNRGLAPVDPRGVGADRPGGRARHGVRAALREHGHGTPRGQHPER